MTEEESAEERAANQEYYEDIMPFYDYKKSPKKVTELSDDFKQYDENGDLIE